MSKRNVLLPLPAGAEIRGEGEDRHAYWIETSGPRSRERSAPVVATRTRAGAEILKVVAGTRPCYYGAVREADGRWRTVRLFTDKVASERRLAELQRLADRRASGILTADVERLALPIADLTKLYHDVLRARNSDADHVRISEGMLRRLIDAAGWRYFTDVTADSVTKVLPEIASTASYQNKFIMRAKALVRWALPEGWPDPLKKLHRVREKGAKRNRERRAATAEELAGLLALELPDDRRLAYALAAMNGLRRNEQRKLTWDCLRLEAPIPFVEIVRKQGHDDEPDHIPLHPYVVSLLRGRLVLGATKVLRSVPDVATLKKDWKRAGVGFTDDRGRRLDFHALRHTFETNLDRTGCSRATKKRLMRHANEDVTDGYAHAELAEMIAALQRLPSPADVPEEQAKTGTCGDVRHLPAASVQRATAAQSAGPDGSRPVINSSLALRDARPCPPSEVLYNPPLVPACPVVSHAGGEPPSGGNFRPSTQVD